MNLSRIYIFVFLGVLKSIVSQAEIQDFIEGSNFNSSFHIPYQSFSRIEDKEDQYTIQEISSASFSSAFKEVKDFPCVSSSVFWYRLNIHWNKQTKTPLLLINNLMAESICLYISDTSGSIIKKKSGTGIYYDEKEIKDKNHLFILNLKPGENTIYFSIKSPSPKFEALLIHETYYHSLHQKYVGIAGIELGIIFIIFIGNGLLLFFFRDKISFYFGLYIFFVSLLITGEAGFIHGSLWLDAPFLTMKLPYLFSNCSNGLKILVIITLISSYRTDNIIHKLNVGVLLFFLIVTVFSMLLPSWIIYIMSISGFYITSLWLLFISIYIIRENNFIRYILATGSILFITNQLFISLDVYPFQIQNYIFSGSIIAEMIILLLCIGYKIQGKIEDNIYKTISVQDPVLNKPLVHVNNGLQDNNDFSILSKREIEVLEKIEKGFTDKEIALELGLTVATIKSHSKKIYDKLGVRNRMEAVVKFKNNTFKKP